MPNTEVKPFSADGTWLETTWESRTLPDSMKKGLTPNGVGSFFSYNQKVLLPDYPNQCAALYLVRIFPAARSAGCRKNHLGEWEEERRNNFVHPEKSFLQIIFDKVRERTWLDSSLRQKALL